MSLIIIIIGCLIFYFIGRRGFNILPSLNKDFNQSVIVDTSSLIDGRILEVAKTGFMTDKLIIFNFILSELQNIADSSDPLRRSKGRRGLKVLKSLQKLPQPDVEIIDEDIDDVSKIDTKLVEKAKEMDAKILTTDYNLNEVAKIQNVTILNINELSNAIKPILLPGEQTEVKVVQKGKEKGQGVGYLEDGTMIVVEDGERFLHRKVRCEVSRIFQTEAGRMIFVKTLEAPKRRFIPKVPTSQQFSRIFRRTPQFFIQRNKKDNRTNRNDYKNNNNHKNNNSNKNDHLE